MGMLERLYVFMLMQRIIVTVASGAAVVETSVGEPCVGLDSLFGCGGTITGVLASFVLGSIAGAPAIVNLVLVVAINGLAVLAWLKYGRGVND